MYLDFEDYRPEFTPVGRAISIREGVLIAFILHLLAIIVLLVSPRFLPDTVAAARARALLLAQQRLAEPPRFVFVQPRIDRPAPKPPVRGDLSDQDRVARTPERAPNPTNPLPYSRGNTTERVEAEERQAKARDAAPGAQNPPQQQAQAERPKIPEAPNSLPMPVLQPTPPQTASTYSPGGRIMSDAIEHFERHIPQQYNNPGGGGGSQIGPLQFDTKGVEFGPWVRRFVAQIRRNWNVPEAAMFMKGHVVITFNVHKDGALTDLTIIGPCAVDSFNTAAYGALVSSNPTYPLPPEYPADRAFFTVTFFYNENPQ
jgi:outer membrane biosynthesis protein TonB